MDANSLAVRHRPLLGGARVPLRAHAVAIARSRVLRGVVRRLLLAVPLLIVVSSLSFALVSATGDPGRTVLGAGATPQQVAAVDHQLGFDQPVYTQYWHWLGHAVHGDLGASLFTQEPVTQTLSERFPVTLSLILGSILVTVVIGVFLGVYSAVRGGVLGRFADVLSLAGFALPSFWVGAMLVVLFAVKLHWLPAIGYVPFAQSPSQWLRSLVLPVTALSLAGVATLAKQTREAMLDVLANEHVRMAWANGIPPRLIYYRLALKNVSLRIVTIVSLQLVYMLTGTLFVEQVFALPGLGSIFAASAAQGDLPVVQGITVLFTVIIVLVNLVADVLYTLIDPRVRAS
ncbi:MAG TPA: ABC transporter permease [Trebonia sp.]|nr:ABC transporter permease [Trebonia sp.]